MDEKRSNCEKVEEEVERVVEEAKELQEAAATLINRTSSEEQSLRQRALSLDSNIRRLRSLLHSSISSTNNLLRFDSKLADKDRTALLFLLFPSTLLILRSWIWDGCLPAFPVQLYQAWLLFLYTGLALRENILRINGSDIRPWWIYHHYCAMLMALVSLTWEIKGQPNCAQKQRGVQLFLQWAMMQGVAMLLQNRYQRQRLYTRIALGKAKRMDVVWGETAGVDGQLWLLCPILFILQGFEAYVGLLLLKTALVGVVPEWQVSFCGALLVLMAVGNFINTVQTLMTKSRFKAKMKKSKSKPEF
ncbi:TMPIT-like protein [Citrus sinensis]|uniref:TMPIT-like protein n=1 Tax=Citrus sinensis TaxID=2711 RepID=A0ACB8LNB4_CITSI|nr:TMPIT-like protein [Citrus sinensis]